MQLSTRGLGAEACRQGIATHFFTGCRLGSELQKHTQTRLIQEYHRYGLLGLDEM